MKNEINNQSAPHGENSLANVKEHAPLSAGASVDHGVEVQATEDHINRAADRGCCVSSCSESSYSYGTGEKKSLYPLLPDDPKKALLGVADFINSMKESGAILGNHPEGCRAGMHTASIVDLAWLYELHGIAFEAERVAKGEPQSAI